MDSLTQVVLGASMAEVVLGKKIGNKAMIWGGIAGTIPDLDVASEFVLSEIQSLAFHRGISHSIIFSVLAALFFGLLVHRMYQSKYYKWFGFIGKSFAFAIVAYTLNIFFVSRLSVAQLPLIIATVLISFLLLYYWFKKYFRNKLEIPNASLREWQCLFFLALFTHPLLDCFTTYGTQLFAPFSNFRVAFSTISVADPLYTVPFIICLLVASLLQRDNPKRRFWNYLGIGLSSTYLIFTVFNKQFINHQFQDALEQQEIEYSSFITNPTILNNLLWSCTVKGPNDYYLGYYSLFNKKEVDFIKVPANHDLLDIKDYDPTIETLDWFSDGYWNVLDLGNKAFQISDLRFGTFNGNASNPNAYIFRFKVTQDQNGMYQLQEVEGGPPKGEESRVFATLVDRIFG